MSAYDDALARLDQTPTTPYYNLLAKSGGNPGGMAADGHRTSFFQLLADIVTVAGQIAINTATAAAAALTAVNAPGTSATSPTNLTPSVAAITLTLAQANKAFALGMFVTGYASANNWFAGNITAFNAATGVMTVNAVMIGSAPAASGAWTVALSGPVDATLTARVTALETENARLRDRNRLLSKDLV